jgi:hypothetical protein
MSMRNQERADRLILEAGEEYGDPILGLRFVLPPEIVPEGKGGDSKRTPGIYLAASHPNKSPTAKLRHDERLLSRSEAEEWAAMVDRFARPQRNMGGHCTNVELVRLWYAALGRSLGRAIEAVEARRMDLRETYAAVTREPYGGTDHSVRGA